MSPLVLLLAASLGGASATDSSVYPLIFNPFEVSHWKCLGATLYTNTVAASSYTYDVDVCFMAALALKLSFPWWYQYFSGSSLLPQLRELGVPLVDELPQLEERVSGAAGGFAEEAAGDYAEYYDTLPAPSLQERATTWLSELSKAVTRRGPAAPPAGLSGGQRRPRHQAPRY